MRRTWAIAICVLCASTNQARSLDDVISVSSVTLLLQEPPKNWFGSANEQELIVALERVAPQIEREKNLARRAVARREIGFALARLGREASARKLLKMPQDQSAISSLVALRQVLSGHSNAAVALFPKLDPINRSGIQILLAGALFNWRGDKIGARKWLLEARKNLRQSARKTFPLAEQDSFIELDIARQLAKVGAKADARAVFAALEAKWKPTKNAESDSMRVFYRQVLFDALLSSGLETEARAMLERDSALQERAVSTLFLNGKNEWARAILATQTPVIAWKSASDLRREEDGAKKHPAAFQALQTVWDRLSLSEKTSGRRAVDMANAIADTRGVKQAYAFIKTELSGEVAKEASHDLRAQILSDPRLMDQISPVTLQNWRDAQLREAQNQAWSSEKQLQTQRDFQGAESVESSWMQVGYVALSANNKRATHFALDRAERWSQSDDVLNPAENLLARAQLWQAIGEPKRARQNFARVRRYAAQFTDQPDAVYSFTKAGSANAWIRELLHLQPPRDLRVAIQVFYDMSFWDDRKVTLPKWIAQLPDAPTRAVGIASRARWLLPLETVRIELTPQ